jgi:DNA modification methylase
LMGGDFSDGELAWTSRDRALREFTFCNKIGGKVHPTQKPIELMTWCLGFIPDATTILDPFMGSGTTLVACAKRGKQGIGIEIDEGYFDISCERIRKAYAQPDMFIETARVPEPTQEALSL